MQRVPNKIVQEAIDRYSKGGITQSKLAEDLALDGWDVSQATVSNWISGKRKIKPDVDYSDFQIDERDKNSGFALDQFGIESMERKSREVVVIRIFLNDRQKSEFARHINFCRAVYNYLAQEQKIYRLENGGLPHKSGSGKTMGRSELQKVFQVVKEKYPHVGSIQAYCLQYIIERVLWASRNGSLMQARRMDFRHMEFYQPSKVLRVSDRVLSIGPYRDIKLDSDFPDFSDFKRTRIAFDRSGRWTITLIK